MWRGVWLSVVVVLACAPAAASPPPLHLPFTATDFQPGHQSALRGGPEFALEADPRDPLPPGDRDIVVMIHGYDGSHSALPLDPERDRTFQPFMQTRAYRWLEHRVKFYRFAYRPYMDLSQLGAHCARTLLEVFPERWRGIIFLGHSAGGLVARYAAADPRLSQRVGGIITLATPHHGSVSASILQANDHVVERLGWIDAVLMKRTQRGTPDTPALRSLHADAFDSRVSPNDQVRFNMPINRNLAHFNRTDPNTDKIFAYMGLVHHLWGRYKWGIAGELHRRALASFDSSWATADPVVHFPSGVFEGVHLAAIRVFPGRSHTELPADPEVMQAVARDILAICRSLRAARWAR